MNIRIYNKLQWCYFHNVLGDRRFRVEMIIGLGSIIDRTRFDTRSAYSRDCLCCCVSVVQGILSNSDCFKGTVKDDTSSVYVSSPSQNLVNAGLKANDGSAADIKFQWVSCIHYGYVTLFTFQRQFSTF